VRQVSKQEMLNPGQQTGDRDKRMSGGWGTSG